MLIGEDFFELSIVNCVIQLIMMKFVVWKLSDLMITIVLHSDLVLNCRMYEFVTEVTV